MVKLVKIEAEFVNGRQDTFYISDFKLSSLKEYVGRNRGLLEAYTLYEKKQYFINAAYILSYMIEEN